MGNELLNAALKYATAYGWAVFPVDQTTKRPKTPHGCNDAKTDIGAIINWWEKWPDAAIGVATGSASGVVVVDEDIDEDKGLNGYHEITKWEKEHGSLPETAQSITGRGGYHLFYSYKGTDIRNGTNLMEGVDIRGEGGYVIVPPSVHPNGNIYQWEYSPDDIKIAPVDDTVLQLLASGAKKDSERFELPQTIPSGARNDTLYKMACSLQARGIPDAGILASLQAANKERCVEPVDDEELHRIFESAVKHKKGNIDLELTDVGSQMGKKKKFKKLKKAVDLANKDLPELNVLVGVDADMPLLLEGTCILSAKPKLGKSWFALAMAIAIANGDDFLGFKTQQKSVLYLDFESGEVVQKKRLLQILKGKPVPEKLYLESEADQLDKGLPEQLENYIEQDPDLGLIIIDLFQGIRSESKSYKESEYDHAYRDITPLNEIAQKHHVSIMLVCHDRKAVDPEDPFANILGSTGLQGAVTQMIVMFRKKKKSPIHISVKGKTIDGQHDFNVKIEDAVWSYVDYDEDADDDQAQDREEYENSEIRKAVIKVVEKEDVWQGRCTPLISKAIEYDVPLEDDAYHIGKFLNKHMGRFLKYDNVKISIIKNGKNGPKIYRLSKSSIDSIDENEALSIDGFEKASSYAGSEVPFV